MVFDCGITREECDVGIFDFRLPIVDLWIASISSIRQLAIGNRQSLQNGKIVTNYVRRRGNDIDAARAGDADVDHWANVGSCDRRWRCCEFDSGADIDSGPDIFVCATRRRNLCCVPRDFPMGLAGVDDFYDDLAG